MRFHLLSACLAACLAACLGMFASIAAAQTPAAQLKLRGDRFKPLTYDQMTPEQKTLTRPYP